MRRVKSACWVAAWGVWLWLGFGLYRELPRDLGPVVCLCPLGERERLLGWLADESILATIQDRDDGEPKLVRLYDAKTGEVLTSFDGPITEPQVVNYTTILRHSALLCSRRPDLEGREARYESSMLNLKNGRWIDLPFERFDLDGVAPNEPLAMFSRRQRRQRPLVIEGAIVAENREDYEWRVQVVDLRDGRTVLKLTAAKGAQPPRLLEQGYFFLDDRTIAFATRLIRGDDEEDSPDDVRVEVWRIDAPDKPIKIIKGIHIGDEPSVSQNGCVAWHTIGDVPAHVDVFDFYAERIVLSEPPKSQRKTLPGGTSGSWPSPKISSDGRAVTVPMARSVWDVNRRTVIWRGNDAQWLGVDQSGSTVTVSERWNPGWFSFLPELVTYATRDFSTLRLRQRTWKWTTYSDPDVRESPNWFIDEDTHEVYRLDYPVNYPLLALCQTILALPLVLLWSVLRWRRKRRLRVTRQNGESGTNLAESSSKR